MRRRLTVFFIFFIFCAAVVSASGSSEAQGAAAISEGLDLYRQGKYEDSASKFREAASSEDPQISAAGHYNSGTLAAEMAEQTEDPSSKRGLLKQSWDELKRAADSGGLPGRLKTDVRRNMEIVRRRLDQLPEQQDSSSQNDSDKQSGQQQQGEEDNGSGQPQNPAQGGDLQQNGNDPGELLDRQKDLSSRTSAGGKTSELAKEQRDLQKASEDASLDDAAENQAKAAEALEKGDRSDAVKYQKEAEKLLREASGEQDSGTAQEILNHEAEQNENRNRLDIKGGITDADRNW